MLKIENTEVVGWEAAIRGMRNPKNSWARSDSFKHTANWEIYRFNEGEPEIGENDLSLMTNLRNAGTDHRKYMRMIIVYADIIAPLYWLKEYDTYKVGTVANSCSTMHKIADKEFTIEDFSHEHLWGAFDINVPESEVDTDCWLENEYGEDILPFDILTQTIQMLNKARDLYLATKDKKYWWQMIQLLPSSYNQKRTIMLNYEVLANMYKSRKNHKLDEWHTFCDWIKSLPYSELITGEFENENNA